MAPKSPNPRLIAFCGLAGSGKSTAADHLVKKHHFRRLRFASPIKRMVRCLLNEAGCGLVESVEMVDGNLKEEPIASLGGKSPRYLMQTLGTEWGRDLVARDIWRQMLLAKVSRCLQAGQSVVVDDLRFENEAEALREFGFTVITVTRLCTPFTVEQHSSEQQVISYDRILLNNGPVEMLHADLDLILHTH
jgi:hypothetical protein